MEVISGVPVTEVAPGLQKETDELSAFDPQKAENHKYRSQTLESVKHHLNPPRQRSVGPRQLGDSFEPGDSGRSWDL